ncbi:hypothetical protein PG995_001887 [Apiospora arundinis]
MISKLAAAAAALSLWPGASAAYPSIPVLKDVIGGTANACKLAAGPNGGKLAGFDLADNVKSTGSIKGWMMFIDFPDAEGNGTDPQAIFDSHAPAAEAWYHTSSYEKLSLQISGDTKQIYRMPATTASYQWEGGISSFHLMNYVQDALDAYMKAHGGDASAFPEMDILYLVAPPSATFSNSYAYMYEPETRLPEGAGNETVGTAVAHRAVAFGHDFHSEFNARGYKVLVHETGHTFGLPDYYLTNGTGSLGDLVGGFSLMGATFEQAPDMFGWDKWRMGWLADSAVQCITEKGSTTHVLSPLEKPAESGSKQVVVVATSGTTMLVAEARTKNGVDNELCGPGVLLYTVDTNVASGQGPIRVLNGIDLDLRWCGGYVANLAPLSFTSPRKSSLTLEEFGVTVTLTEHNEATDHWTIKVDYK